MSPAEATTAIEGGVLEGSGAASGVPSKRKQATGDKASVSAPCAVVPPVGKKKRSITVPPTARVLRSSTSTRNVQFQSIPSPPKVPYPPGTRGQGLTALMRAARAGRPEDFNQLADRRAALGAKDKRGRTLLHHAVSGGSWPIVERVLQAKKQSVDARAAGMTPLHIALHRGDVEVAAMLLAAGADPSLVEDVPCPPLEPQEQAAAASAVLGCVCRPVVEVLRALQKALALAVPLRDADRSRPWTDLETQRELAIKWQQSLRAGSRVDVLDCDNRWYEAEVVRVWEGVGGIPEVRVHYRCWGHRFDEDLSLASLRVLPAFSVVPRWREALAVGCPLESLSSTWLGAPPDGKEERKWWDATVQAIDRQKNQVLISVDGRAVLSRWVDVDGEEISAAGTHVKPSPFLGVPQPKDAIQPSARQLEARDAARAGDVTRLLSLVNFEPPGSLALQYWRAKLGLAAASSTPAMVQAAVAAAAAAAASSSSPPSSPSTPIRRAAHYPPPLLLSPQRPTMTITPTPLPKGATEYEEQRREVLKWVCMDMKEDLVFDLLTDYLPALYDR